MARCWIPSGSYLAKSAVGVKAAPATLHPRSFVDFRDTLGRISLSRRSAYARAHYDRAWPQRAQQARCRRRFNVSWGSPTRACSCSRPWHR
eukprot:3356830-Lingulodinium_polyedra.AAC.1